MTRGSPPDASGTEDADARASVVLAWDDGADQRQVETHDPEVVIALLHALNGDERTLVMVERNGSHLAAGGDASTGLVVYLSPDGETFLNLANGTDDATEVTVVAGGQPGEYPRHDVVDVARAERAVRAFVTRGEPDPHLDWRPT